MHCWMTRLQPKVIASGTKADVERTIRDFYIKLPKSYTPDLKKDKRVKTYAHIYENYFGAGQSVYQGMSAGLH